MKNITFTHKEGSPDVEITATAEKGGHEFNVGAILYASEPDPILDLWGPLRVSDVHRLLYAWKEHKS